MIGRTNICTIYLLLNTVNHKIYIGQTWMPLHERMGKDGSNYANSTHLYNAIKKYGSDKFVYYPLFFCKDQITADILEIDQITMYDSQDENIGYNIKEGGSAGKHSEESKRKISETLKYQASLMSSEQLKKKSAPISNWWSGKKRGPQSEERKGGVAQAMVDWHANNPHPMQGKKHSEETRKIISQKGIGRPVTEQTKQKRFLFYKNKNADRDLKVIETYQEDKLSILEIVSLFGLSSVGSVYRILRRYNITLKRPDISQSKKIT